jgi:NADH-quinone oxidoreductase subunit J
VSELIFYVLSAVALLGALGVVFSKSPMGSVLSLLGSFFALAVIYLLAGFPFIAALQVMVYAGAIMVLFLFVIMLLNLGGMGTRFELSTEPLQKPGAKLAAVVAAALGLAGLIAAQLASLPELPSEGAPERIDDLEALAVALFGRYSLPFQAASVLLLATMVAVLVLAKRRPRGGKS